MRKFIVSLNELIDINSNIKELGLPYTISITDSCTMQLFTFKTGGDPAQSEKKIITAPSPDELEQIDALIKEYLKNANKSAHIVIEYSNDKTQFWFKQDV